jgi:hypothetical protein
VTAAALLIQNEGVVNAAPIAAPPPGSHVISHKADA